MRSTTLVTLTHFASTCSDKTEPSTRELGNAAAASGMSPESKGVRARSRWTRLRLVARRALLLRRVTVTLGARARRWASGGSPEECGARVQKDFGTEGGTRLAESRPPDDDEGSPGGRAVSAQSPAGTVMGLLAWRRSLAGVGWIAFRQGGAAWAVGNADVCARQRLQRATLRP